MLGSRGRPWPDTRPPPWHFQAGNAPGRADGNHFYLICNVGHARNYREIDERRVTVREVRLKGTGTPYRLDPWSGKTERIAAFRREGDYLAVPVSLQENDTCLIAMTEEEILPLPDKAHVSLLIQGLHQGCHIMGMLCFRGRTL